MQRPRNSVLTQLWGNLYPLIGSGSDLPPALRRGSGSGRRGRVRCGEREAGKGEGAAGGRAGRAAEEAVASGEWVGRVEG